MDLFSLLDSCKVYIKRGVLGVRTLGKGKCYTDTREPRLHNRISITIHFYERPMASNMFPTPRAIHLVKLSAPYTKPPRCTSQVKLNFLTEAIDIVQIAQNWSVLPYFLMIMYFSKLELTLVSFHPPEARMKYLYLTVCMLKYSLHTCLDESS